MKYIALSLALGLVANAGVLQERGGNDYGDKCPPPSTVWQTKTETKEHTQYVPTTVIKKETDTKTIQTTIEKPTTIVQKQTDTTTVQTTIEKPAKPTTITITSTKQETLPGTTKTVSTTETQKETVTSVLEKPAKPTTLTVTSVKQETLPGTTKVEKTTVTAPGTTKIVTQQGPKTTVTAPGTTMVVTQQGQKTTITAPAGTITEKEQPKTITSTLTLSGRVQTIKESAKIETTTITAPGREKTIQGQDTTIYKTAVITEKPHPPPASTSTSTVTITHASSCPKAGTLTVVRTEKQTLTEHAPAPPAKTAPAPPASTKVVTQPAPAPPANTHPVAPAPPPASSAVSPPKASGTCPLELPKSFEYPHLIVPVDSASPSKAAGTSYNGKATSSVSSLFNFDIPYSAAGKTCRVVFALPTQAQLETSSFTVSGSGNLTFSSLEGPAGKATTFANAPKIVEELNSVGVEAGNAYEISSGPCAAGKVASYEISATDSFAIDYFQDYNPCPIGLYIIPS